MISDVVDLDATAVLSAAEDLTREQRERDVDLLRLVLQWADLHADDPGQGRVLGSDQLIDFGGEGTPPVRGEPGVGLSGHRSSRWRDRE